MGAFHNIAINGIEGTGMSYGLKRAVRRELRLGRLSIPVWSIGLAVAVAGLAAGQAVGPVLNGSVADSTGLR